MKFYDNQFLSLILVEQLRPNEMSAPALDSIREHALSMRNKEAMSAKAIDEARKRGIARFQEWLQRRGMLLPDEPLLPSIDDVDKTTQLPDAANTNQESEASGHVTFSSAPVITEMLQPADMSGQITPPSSPKETEDMLELYFGILTPASYYLPYEWQGILDLARSSQHLILEGMAGSGKTTLIQIVGWQLRSDWVPVHVDLSQYAVHARDMDIVRLVKLSAMKPCKTN